MTEGDSPKWPWPVLAVLCLGAFVVLMDSTIVNVAVPSLIVSLHAGLDDVLWINNSYLLVFGALLIAMSRLGDVYGPRRLFVIGLAVFALSSALCGLTRNPGELIAARAVQGLGAAILSPQPLVLISATFPPKGRGAALGLFASMIGFAAVLGPTIGGLLVSYVGWQWIFYVNVPIALVGIVLTLRIVPDLRLGRRHRIDLPGVLLATLGLLGVIFGLIEGQRYDWDRLFGGPITVPEVIGAGVVCLAGFVWWERRRRNTEPLLPPALFADRVITLLAVLTGLVQFALISLMLLSGFNLQSVLGLSAVVAGLASLPLTVVLAAVAPLAGRLSDRIGSRALLTFGFATYAAGMVLLGVVLSAHATPWTFVAPFALCGLGMGCLFAPLNTEALRRCRPELTAALSGVLNTSRQLGSAVGSAVVGAVLANRLVSAMQSHAVQHAATLPPPLRPAFTSAFHDLAHTGLQVGRGESGGAQLPAGLSGPDSTRLAAAVHSVFVQGYIDAMRFTVAVPAALLICGAVACVVLVRRHKAMAPSRQATAVPATADAVSQPQKP